jgi:hypothetical protein
MATNSLHIRQSLLALIFLTGLHAVEVYPGLDTTKANRAPVFFSSLALQPQWAQAHLHELLRSHSTSILYSIYTTTVSKFVEWPQSVVREFTANRFQQCFRQLYQRWHTCIAANSNYFEGRCGSA